MHRAHVARTVDSPGLLRGSTELHVREIGLPQSSVQIKRLLELLLPPDTARELRRGSGAKLWGVSLERAEKCPSSPSHGAGATSRKASWALGKRAWVHRQPCPLGPSREELRGPEEMQRAPSQSLWPLEPETKDPVTKNSSPQTVASFLQASHDLLGNE